MISFLLHMIQLMCFIALGSLAVLAIGAIAYDCLADFWEALFK